MRESKEGLASFREETVKKLYEQLDKLQALKRKNAPDDTEVVLKDKDVDEVLKIKAATYKEKLEEYLPTLDENVA